MSNVIIRLQGLPWSASALDIRNFFQGLQIPPGGVHIIGGDKGDAFIAFGTDEDARQAMMKTFQSLSGSPVQLFLSSKTEMQNVIEAARSGQMAEPAPEPAPVPTQPEPVKSYDDPYARNAPPLQNNGGYRDDFQNFRRQGGIDMQQGMYGKDQMPPPQPFREEYSNQPPQDAWNQNHGSVRHPEVRPPFGGREVPVGPQGGPPFDERMLPEGPFTSNQQGPPFGRPEGPPFGIGGPVDRRPLMDERGPLDRRPPMDERGPIDRRPPMDERGPMDRRPPMDERGPMDRRPPMDERGPMDRRPLIDERGPMDRRPLMDERGPMDRRPLMDERGPMDRRPPMDERLDQRSEQRPNQRPDHRDSRRGPDNRFSDRDGRDSRERDGRDRDGKERDSRDGRDRRDRSDRERFDRDRERDRGNRFDRSDRFDRPDRFDRFERSDRLDRSDRRSDRDRRDYSDSRRDSRDSRERPNEDKPELRSISRPPREGPPRDGPPRDGPPRDGPPRDGPPRPGNNLPSLLDMPGPDSLRKPDNLSDQRPVGVPGELTPRNDEYQGGYPPRGDPIRPRAEFELNQRIPPGSFDKSDPNFRPDQAQHGPPDGARSRFDGPRGTFDGPPGPMDPRGTPEGPRGRGQLPPFQEQGNGFDRDNRRPDHDFRGPPRGDPSFAGSQPPVRRPVEDGPPNMRNLDHRERGYPRGPNDFPPFPVERDHGHPWDRKGPDGPHGRGAPHPPDFDRRPGPMSGPGGKGGLLGDAPGMRPGGRGPRDMSMDHDGREPRPLMQELRGPPGEWGRGSDDFDNRGGRGRIGRDPDPRDNRDTIDRGPRGMMGDSERRPDWRPRGERWTEDSRGPRPYGSDGPYPPERGRPMEEQNRKRPRGEPLNACIHVKNLPYSISYSMVRRFFTGCEIPFDGLKLINNEQGKRNGVAYIRFVNEDSCLLALKRNGMDLGGRNVILHRCNIAEFESAIDSFTPDDDDAPDPSKRLRSDDRRSDDRPRRDGETNEPKITAPYLLKISNLPLDVSIEDLRKLLSSVAIAGNGSFLFMDFDSIGRFTGTAVVEVMTSTDAKATLAFEGKAMGSRILRVCLSNKSDFDKARSSQPKVVTSSKTTDTSKQVKSDSADERRTNEAEFPYSIVHITGMSTTASFKEVRDFVSGLEVISRGIQVVHDAQGKSTGEAFVEFVSSKDCKEAVKRDQQMIGSKKVTLKGIYKAEMIRRLREARRTSVGSGPNGQTNEENQGQQSVSKPIPPGVLKRQWIYLRCSNLPLQVTIRELLAFFNKYNPVPESIRLHYTGDGNPTGNAVVGFPAKEDATRAMDELNGTLCRQNAVVIQPAN